MSPLNALRAFLRLFAEPRKPYTIVHRTIGTDEAGADACTAAMRKVPYIVAEAARAYGLQDADTRAFHEVRRLILESRNPKTPSPCSAST